MFKKLCPEMDANGIYVVGGRATRWFEASYNKRLVPILPKDSFSKLYVEMVHKKKHGGVDSDVVSVRLEFWVIGLRRMCTNVRKSCVMCRKLCGKMGSQKMQN